MQNLSQVHSQILSISVMEESIELNVNWDTVIKKSNM